MAMNFKECVSDIKNKRNVEIYGRNIPSQNLQPYINVRPVMTKYSKLPIVDPRKELFTKLNEMPVYNVSKTFNPGTGKSPWSGFSSNVNLESELRNQIFALQKDSKSVYVPTSSSNLYKSDMKHEKYTGTHKNLFVKEKFNEFNPNVDSAKIGCTLFNNATRQQLKDLED
jgi:hypothetical protein